MDIFRSIGSLTMVATLLHAQVPGGRPASSDNNMNDQVGSTAVTVTEEGRVYLTDYGVPTIAQADFQSSITDPTDFTVWGIGAPAHVLVTGITGAGHSRIEHWELTGPQPTWTPISYLDRSGELAGITFDGTYLYVVDGQARVIERAAWSTQQDLATVVFTTFATVSDLPELQDAGEHILRFFPDGSLEGVSGDRVFLTPYASALGDQEGALVDGSPGALGIQRYLRGMMHDLVEPAPPVVYADEGEISEADTAVEVFAMEGAVVEVVEGATVLGTGVVPIGGDSVIVPLSGPLQIGHVYEARVAADPTYTYKFACVRRYGSPEVFSDDAELGRIPMSPPGYVIGRTLELTLPIDDPTPDTVGVDYAAQLAVGVRVGQVDPVVTYGTNMLLVTDVYLPAQGYVVQDTGIGSVTATVDIPGDPSLVGTTMLFQFLVSDGVVVRLSEVVGAKILAP